MAADWQADGEHGACAPLPHPTLALRSPLCVSSCVGSERHDLVVGVMPDVGASQPRNPRPPAPVTSDLHFVHPEVRLVRADGVATAKHYARHPPNFGIAGDMKQRTINPVHCL